MLACRRMDSKSDSEEMIYPHVCFSVDNFDEAFGDIQVEEKSGTIWNSQFFVFEGEGARARFLTSGKKRQFKIM